MAILQQVQKTLKNYSAGDIDQALMDILIAVDATSKNEYPEMKKNGERYKKFLVDNMFLIQIVTLNVRMGNKITFKNVFGSGQFKHGDTMSLDEIIYHIIRCNLLHEAELPVSIAFTDEAIIRLEPTQMIISKNLILALLVTVMVAKTNTNNKIDSRIEMNIYDKKIQLNKIWGKKELLLNLLG